MLNKIKRWFSSQANDAHLQQRLEELRQHIPVPVFWLLGKTQSGKTTIIKYLTGVPDAEIGHGFRPCTRFSRRYQFPTPEAPLITFLDTRGLEEPGYDPAEDLAAFNDEAHLILVVVKALDHAQEVVEAQLKIIRRAQPQRPIVLVLTCLHEGYPQQQHPQPYPYGAEREQTLVPEDLRRSIIAQERRFAGLVDRVVPIDLTAPEEGFTDPTYGGPLLKQALQELLPAAYRQTWLTFDAARRELQDWYAQRALPYILGYSSLAATAGAVPIPWLDLLLLPAIQTQMIHHLARLYGQPLRAVRFAELASTLGLGMLFRQVTREVVKFIPFVGSVAGSALAGTATFALGKAFCFYYSAIHQGHVPKPEELRRYYREQLGLAEKAWAHLHNSVSTAVPAASAHQESS